MKTIFKLSCIVFFFVLPTLSSGQESCVPADIAITAWTDAVLNMNRPTSGLVSTPAICTPCSCPVNGMAACYEYMAQGERDKQNHYEQALALIDRVRKYGICMNENERRK